MFDPSNPSVSLLWLSLAIVLVSMMLVARHASALILRRPLAGVRHVRWIGMLSNIGAMVVFPVLAVAAVQAIEITESPLRNTVVKAGIVVLTCLTLWLHVRSTRRDSSTVDKWRVLIHGMSLIASIGGVLLSSSLFFRMSHPYEDGLFLAGIQGHTGEVPHLIGVTDRGRDVVLLRVDPDTNDFARQVGEAIAKIAKEAPASIRRAKADRRSNCHGWVFTGGKYLLDSEGVARILEDNGYHSVDRPQAGDVVIYRDTLGVINHTGLVRGLLDDATVLIESKWSIGDRFLHLPESQPYSDSLTYYRTSRRNHLVAIRSRKDAQTSQGPRQEPRAIRATVSEPDLRSKEKTATRSPFASHKIAS